MLIYGLKNCDTCRKAKKAFPDATLVDVRTQGVPDDVIAAALTKFGDALINTRSTTWRGLNASEKELPKLDLLKDYPALMKRPLISMGGALFLSWNNDVQVDLKAML